MTVIEGGSSKIVSIASIIIDSFFLQKFFRVFSYLPALSKSNIFTYFCLTNFLRSLLLLQSSFSFLRLSKYTKLLVNYPNPLQVYLPIIIYFRAKLGYDKLINVLIFLKNLFWHLSILR